MYGILYDGDLLVISRLHLQLTFLNIVVPAIPSDETDDTNVTVLERTIDGTTSFSIKTRSVSYSYTTQGKLCQVRIPIQI
jgi:hypothetical protein